MAGGGAGLCCGVKSCAARQARRPDPRFWRVPFRLETVFFADFFLVIHKIGNILLACVSTGLTSAVDSDELILTLVQLGGAIQMRKLLALLLSVGLCAALGVGTTGCGKKDKKTTTTTTGVLPPKTTTTTTGEPKT